MKLGVIAFSCINIALRLELAELTIFEFSLCRQIIQSHFVANRKYFFVFNQNVRCLSFYSALALCLQKLCACLAYSATRPGTLPRRQAQIQ